MEYMVVGYKNTGTNMLSCNNWNIVNIVLWWISEILFF